MLDNFLSKFADLPESIKINIGLFVINLSILFLITVGWITSFKDFFAVTGTMGDTTGPVIGLIGALLIYKTYRDQRSANRFAAESVSLNFILSDLDKIEDLIHNIQYKTKKGQESVDELRSELYNITEFDDFTSEDKIKHFWDLSYKAFYYLYQILYILRRLFNLVKRIKGLGLDERLDPIIIEKVKYSILIFLKQFDILFDEISDDLNFATADESQFDNAIINDLNKLIYIRKTYESYLDYLVEENLAEITSRISEKSIKDSIDQEALEKLKLTQMYIGRNE